MIAIAVLIFTAIASAGAGIFSTPAMTNSNAGVNLWAQVRYPDAPRATYGIVGGTLCKVVYDPEAVLEIWATSDSSNQKSFRLELPDGRAVKFPNNRGDRKINYATVPVSELATGMIGIGAVVGQKAAHEAVISLPIIGNIGKRGIYGEDWGMLLLQFTVPLFGPESYKPIPLPNMTVLSAKEVCLIASNEGGSSECVDSNQNVIRQIAEKQLTDLMTQLLSQPQAQATTRFDITPEPRRHQSSGIRMERRPETGSVHYQITLPEGVTKVRYSLTQTEEPIWQEVTVTSNHIRLPIEFGTWHFWCQAIGPSGPIGEPVHEVIQGGG